MNDAATRRGMGEVGLDVADAAFDSRRSVCERLAIAPYHAKARDRRFDLDGVGRVALQGGVEMEPQTVDDRARLERASVERAEVDRQGQIPSRSQGLIGVGAQALDAELDVTVAGHHGRSARTLDAGEARADAAGDPSVESLLTVEVDGEVVRGDAILPRHEPHAGKLHRTVARERSPRRRLPAQRERSAADFEPQRGRADHHVRQVCVDGDRPALGQTDDWPHHE